MKNDHETFFDLLGRADQLFCGRKTLETEGRVWITSAAATPNHNQFHVTPL